MTRAVARSNKRPQEIATTLPRGCRVTAVSLDLPQTLSLTQWQEVGETLGRMERAVQWWIGDWVRFGAHRYGERHAHHIEATGLTYQGINGCQWVASTFELVRRRTNLSWSHHQEVAALEDPSEQDRLLDQAETKGWTRSQLRASVRALRRGLAAPPPLPTGVYDVLLADPPWEYDNAIESWGPASLHYPTQSLEDLMARAVEIEPLAAPDATLFLWVTNPFLAEGLALAKAWGFTYKTNIVWIKTERKRPGSGFYVRGHHELLFICTRGQHVPDQTGRAPISSVLEAPVGAHSAKPVESYERIEALYPEARRVELFARGQVRDGWTGWGNESA